MKYLFVHDALPGQFIHLLKHLHSAGHEVCAAGRRGLSSANMPVQQVFYDVAEQLNLAKANAAEQAIALGLGLHQALKPLYDAGYRPDAIISHAGRGASFFLKDLFPNARFTGYFEWYHRAEGIADDLAATIRRHQSVHIANLATEREFDIADAAYAPTHFQASQLPWPMQRQTKIIHDGIDTSFYAPQADAVFEFGERRFSQNDEIITYAARGMEHTRGFPAFMQAVALLQKRRPKLEVLIAGADRICYDSPRQGPGLRAWADANIDYDQSRTHFLGLVGLAPFVDLLRVSSVHAYLSAPFILSWSVLNAMSTGCLVLGSDNAPVQEILDEGQNGFLVDEKDPEAIAGKLDWMLDHRDSLGAVRAAARETVKQRYELSACLKRQLALINGSSL